MQISSVQYFSRLLHLPCLLHVQHGPNPQVGNLNIRFSPRIELSLLSLIQRTGADNLAEDSPAAWFLVFATALWYWLACIPSSITHPLSFSVNSPWLVLCLMVMLMRRVGKLTAPASSYNSTLIWLWPKDVEEVLLS